MEIGLNWLGSSCREPYALSLDLRVQTIFRKMAKVSENSGKFIKNKNSLRSVFVAAWPELVQFNCGNFLVCLCLFFTNKEKNKISFCLFLCLWKRARQTLVSRLKYWLWLAAAALGYSIEMREIFFENWNKILVKDLIEYFFLNQKLISFDDTNIKRQLNWSSNSWFCWVF